ncbi:type II secretion system protein GspL [Hyphomonas sp.]|uniref:type II secretion system protein GspL n=1 Tax=Hyphomonas sp. TaxID=87 RepID=UPI0025C19446|nr:type II secretion system protein GspL [Hyphomonas sp.]
MNADIYIELPASTGAPFRLAVRRGNTLHPEDFSTFKASGRPKAVAFAPALSVAKFRIPVAAKSESEARRAALYAIEDDLAQSVDDVHLLLAPKQAGTRTRDVYVADKALLQHWTTRLQSAGLGYAEIVPEASLALAPGALFDFGDRLLMHGRDGILGADRTWPEDVLLEILRKAGLSDANVTSANALETLAALEARAPGVRLTETRGAGAAREGSAFRRWRLAGMLVLAATAIWIAGIQFEINSLLTTARKQEADARAAYRQQFAGAPEPVDIDAEVRRLSAATSAEPAGNFLGLSAAVYEALALQPGAQLRQLQYTQSDASLRAVLRFAAAPEAEAYRAALEASGWSAQTESLTDLAPGTEAAFILRAAP